MESHINEKPKDKYFRAHLQSGAGIWSIVEKSGKHKCKSYYNLRKGRVCMCVIEVNDVCVYLYLYLYLLLQLGGLA